MQVSRARVCGMEDGVPPLSARGSSASRRKLIMTPRGRDACVRCPRPRTRGAASERMERPHRDERPCRPARVRDRAVTSGHSATGPVYRSPQIQSVSRVLRRSEPTSNVRGRCASFGFAAGRFHFYRGQKRYTYTKERPIGGRGAPSAHARCAPHARTQCVCVGLHLGGHWRGTQWMSVVTECRQREKPMHSKLLCMWCINASFRSWRCETPAASLQYLESGNWICTCKPDGGRRRWTAGVQ